MPKAAVSGGSTLYDFACFTATDSQNNVYIAEYTNSTYGIALGGYDTIYGGGTYVAFLVIFDSGGNKV